ncbi:hypothetical protein FRC04_004977 [Tulasnella sp. 424]|nr:hypothetical protein FRC04_004977 [Tulasnella sp. 424]
MFISSFRYLGRTAPSAPQHPRPPRRSASSGTINVVQTTDLVVALIFNYLTSDRPPGRTKNSDITANVKPILSSAEKSLTQLSIRSSESLSRNGVPPQSDTLIPFALSHVALRVPNVPPIHRVPEDIGPGLQALEGDPGISSNAVDIPLGIRWPPHVRNALRRTAQAPLDIVYHGNARCKADAFLLLVKDKIRYWRTVDLSLSGSSEVLSDIQTSRMPLLETFKISYRIQRHGPAIDLFGEPNVSSKLTELGIQGLSVAIPLWLANLTSLSLEAVSHVTIEEVLRVLQNSTGLKVLKLKQLFTPEPNEAIPHITHLPSLRSLDLWLPVAVIHYLLSGLRIDLLSRLHLSCDMDGVPLRGNLLSNRITHFIPTIRELVCRAARIEFEFEASGVYSVGLGDLNLIFDAEPAHDQYHSARDVFEWLAEHLGPDLRAIPARLRFEDHDPFVEHLELYGSFPNPRVVEIILCEFDPFDGTPISVLRYLGSPRQSDPSQWPFPHLETINYRLDKSQNRYLVEMLRSRYGDPKQIQQTTLQPPQPLKEIRIYEVNGVDVTQTDTSFLKEVQDLAAGAKIFWQDQVVTFA